MEGLRQTVASRPNSPSESAKPSYMSALSAGINCGNTTRIGTRAEGELTAMQPAALQSFVTNP
jgi:hypothetical protein